MAETKKQEVAKVSAPTTAIAKFSSGFTDIVCRMGETNELTLSTTQRLNVTAACNVIYKLCQDEGITTKDLNQNNLTEQLFRTAVLNLNPVATPRECYFTIKKIKQKDGTKLPTLELGIEGDGNDALVRKYGDGVASLDGPYIVREGDALELPYFDGEKNKIVGPNWKRNSLDGKALYVFYVIKKTDGTYDYPISSRESVATNLKAAINNNLFGVKEEQKEEILERIEDMKLDEMLKDKSLRKMDLINAWNGKTETKTLISPAWTAPHSRESMIIRKMRNNCLRKYRKNFDNAFQSAAYDSLASGETNSVNPDYIDAEYEEKKNTEEVKTSIPFNKETGEVVEEPTPVQEEQKVEEPVKSQEPIVEEKKNTEEEPF